jgi:hypothetical protein
LGLGAEEGNQGLAALQAEVRQYILDYALYILLAVLGLLPHRLNQPPPHRLPHHGRESLGFLNGALQVYVTGLCFLAGEHDFLSGYDHLAFPSRFAVGDE